VIGVSLVNDGILKVVNVDAGYVVKYKSKRIKFIHAVNNVSLELRLNRVLGIAGESGCGKTTLAKIIY
jgi:ABC-type glutathione transport system ATPase component